MLIPSYELNDDRAKTSLSRRVNANSQLAHVRRFDVSKLIKKGEC